MIVSKQLTIKMRGNGDAIDITPEVERAIREAHVTSVIVTLFVVGSTAALTKDEYERVGVTKDIGVICSAFCLKN